MTTNPDFRTLCAELIASWDADGCDWKPQHQARWEATVNCARAALADEPAVPEGKKPTRDELWELWLRLNNELPDRPAAVAEFWEHAQIDARARAALAKADGPAVPEGREPAAVTKQPNWRGLCEELVDAWLKGDDIVSALIRAHAVLARWGNPTPQPPAAGEVAELVAEIRHFLAGYQQMRGLDPEHIYSIHRGDKMEAHITVSRLTRAAELLERQALVPVSERPWEREGWCDTGGLCWLGSHALDGSTPTWLYGPPAWAERFPNVHRVLLPAHAMPLPEVNNG